MARGDILKSALENERSGVVKILAVLLESGSLVPGIGENELDESRPLLVLRVGNSVGNRDLVEARGRFLVQKLEEIDAALQRVEKLDGEVDEIVNRSFKYEQCQEVEG